MFTGKKLGEEIVLDKLKLILPFLKDPQWATIVVTILISVTSASYYLYQKRKSTREKRNKDVLEQIINPLSVHFVELTRYIKSLCFPPSYGIQYGRIIVNEDPLWNKIKQENFYIMSNLNKKIYNKIDHFSSNIKKLIFLYNQNFDQFTTLLVDVLKPITERDSYPGGPREAVSYQASIGGKSIRVFIPTLIFLDQSLEEYIEKNLRDETILNKRIKNEAFMIGGLEQKDRGRKDFDDILLTVTQKISEKPDLQKFIEESRNTYKEVEDLIKSLEEEKKRLAEI